MSKECPGKYHGKAVKHIKDDEKYCKICQQEIALRKKRRNEVLAGFGGAILAVGGFALKVVLGGKGGKGKK